MMRQQPLQHSDNNRSSGELCAFDCNLTFLCDHIQLEGFNNGFFSDIVVRAMGSTYHLRRLILFRSSYFRYVGRLFLKSSGMPIEILTKLNEMAGFDPDEELDLFEEVRFEPAVMCERLDKRTSFRFSQIQDGDIICFQKTLSTSK